MLCRGRAFDDRHRIANPGFMGHMQHRLLINDPDGIPSEHRIAGARGHPRRRMDLNVVLME